MIHLLIAVGDVLMYIPMANSGTACGLSLSSAYHPRRATVGPEPSVRSSEVHYLYYLQVSRAHFIAFSLVAGEFGTNLSKFGVKNFLYIGKFPGRSLLVVVLSALFGA